MRAKELIKKLENALEKHGNVIVRHSTYGESIVQSVQVYDKHGNTEKPITEIHLH